VNLGRTETENFSASVRFALFFVQIYRNNAAEFMQINEIGRKSAFLIDFTSALWDDMHKVLDYMTF